MRLRLAQFAGGAVAMMAAVFTTVSAQEPAKQPSSYSPVVISEPFSSVMSRMSSAKAGIMQKQQAHLAERYDLSNKPAGGATMFRGKAIQGGVRAKLRGGASWDSLAKMSPDEVKNKDAFPIAFMPLPHANHGEGGMIFPKFHIDEIKKQEDRDLTRFDLDFDLCMLVTRAYARSTRCTGRVSAHREGRCLTQEAVVGGATTLPGGTTCYLLLRLGISFGTSDTWRKPMNISSHD